MIPSQLTRVTRHARRVYVGDLPTGVDEQLEGSSTSPFHFTQHIPYASSLWFSCVMVGIGAYFTGPDLAVVDIYINRENKYAILEMRSVALASNAMVLDGIIF
ncbi:hypothetical protein IFM89_009552 [Coptis chinensis]|uniref:Uncharacterized protein n=1 Tax=Coptis chinensis TaxID=261450 RepID=A0A835IAM1_9MAGN|nr:hypothetical protein IFM89_009552 [Coptis chinensis]